MQTSTLEPVIRQAAAHEADVVSSILQEAARWLIERGMPLWRAEELKVAGVEQQVADGMFYLAMVGGTAAGCVRFQLEDRLFWPDLPNGDSGFVHRLAVRRKFAGGEISAALLAWARRHAAQLGRQWLRLDTVADRPALRSVYERNGFEFHSIKQIGPHTVARYQIRTQ